MRARLAITESGQSVELREVSLKDKPTQMLDISPKGTVPVLQLPDGRVIEESYEIMLWALGHNDPNNWLRSVMTDTHQELLKENDGPFKKLLDTYKYANRHPELTEEEHRKNAEPFLQKLEDLLSEHTFLIDNAASITDAMIFPFIRQFTRVDQEWFDQAAYPKLKNWLEYFYDSSLLSQTMTKYPIWSSDQEKQLFPPKNLDKNT